MIQTQVYPLHERAAAFCRGFKTLHPFVEVAKEGLKKPGLGPELKKDYEERVRAARVSPQELFERRKERLLHAKLFYLASCMTFITQGPIPTYPEENKELLTIMMAMCTGTFGISLGLMKSVIKHTKSGVLTPLTMLGGYIGVIISTNIFFEASNLYRLFGEKGALIFAGGVTAVLAGYHCISRVLREKITDPTEKPEAKP